MNLVLSTAVNLNAEDSKGLTALDYAND